MSKSLHIFFDPLFSSHCRDEVCDETHITHRSTVFFGKSLGNLRFLAIVDGAIAIIEMQHLRVQFAPK